jgi:IclR family KDG regulon transcriptional repressor
MKREKLNYLIQSVSHALDVLEALCKANGEVGVTELSKDLKLHKNNVFRLLATLQVRGYVDQNRDSEDYRLGVMALQLGQSYLLQTTLVGRGTPILRELSEAIGETVSFVTLQGGNVHFPISIESKRPVRVSARVATSIPSKLNAAGRLLIAQLPDAALTEVLAPNTVHDVAIKSQLAELRSSGQIIDRGAIEADVLTIAKVVRGYNNEVVGALEVSIPSYRGKVDGVMQKIDDAAKTLSTVLGAAKVTSTLVVEKEVVASAAQASSGVAAIASIAGGGAVASVKRVSK